LAALLVNVKTLAVVMLQETAKTSREGEINVTTRGRPSAHDLLNLRNVVWDAPCLIDKGLVAPRATEKQTRHKGIGGRPTLTVSGGAARGIQYSEEGDMVQVPKWLVAVIALFLMVGLAAPVLADETKGKIKTVSADKKEFVFTDKDNKDWTFQVSDDAKIKLEDKDIKLNDLKPGDMVTVTYTKKGDKLIATEVKCEKK
jgi:hypothetical protein